MYDIKIFKTVVKPGSCFLFKIAISKPKIIPKNKITTAKRSVLGTAVRTIKKVSHITSGVKTTFYPPIYKYSIIRFSIF